MQTEITPEALENPNFTSKMRGYDPDEVNELLGRVAAVLRQQKQAADRAYQVVGEELGDMLQQARDRADEMLAAAEKEAAETTLAASMAAQKARDEADKDAARARKEAEDDATTIRAEANSAASEMTEDAQKESTRVRTEAAEAADQLRAAVEKDAQERTARADERVRQLESKEADVRERLSALRMDLVGITTQLEALARQPLTSDGEINEAYEAEPDASPRLPDQLEDPDSTEDLSGMLAEEPAGRTH